MAPGGEAPEQESGLTMGAALRSSPPPAPELRPKRIGADPDSFRRGEAARNMKPFRRDPLVAGAQALDRARVQHGIPEAQIARAFGFDAEVAGGQLCTGKKWVSFGEFVAHAPEAVLFDVLLELLRERFPDGASKPQVSLYLDALERLRASL